jgi:uncharacterized repeat protein (TIGR04076 family)
VKESKNSNQPLSFTDVKVRVVFVKGICNAGHEVGQEWIVRRHTPKGMCVNAFGTIFHSLYLLLRGGKLETVAGSGVLMSACPDAWNQVVFELSPIPGTKRKSPKLSETFGLVEYLQHLPLKKNASKEDRRGSEK